MSWSIFACQGVGYPSTWTASHGQSGAPPAMHKAFHWPNLQIVLLMSQHNQKTIKTYQYSPEVQRVAQHASVLVRSSLCPWKRDATWCPHHHHHQHPVWSCHSHPTDEWWGCEPPSIRNSEILRTNNVIQHKFNAKMLLTNLLKQSSILLSIRSLIDVIGQYHRYELI